MSFADRLVLWLHIGFAVFTIGPLTLAISSTPRYIRKRDAVILRYLTRITTIFTVGSLTVLVFGVVLGQLMRELSRPWLTAAMTLFLVAIVLLVMIIRDQRAAIRAVEEAVRLAGVNSPADGTAAGSDHLLAAGPADPVTGSAVGAGADPAADAGAAHLASVERGRIVAMGGVVNLIWLVVLALMVWQP